MAEPAAATLPAEFAFTPAPAALLGLAVGTTVGRPVGCPVGLEIKTVGAGEGAADDLVVATAVGC